MSKNNLKTILELTAAVYRLTAKFPAGEVLKNRLRETALDILRDFILRNFSGIMKKTKLITGYFLVARKQNWAQEINYEILIAAYRNLGLPQLKTGKSVSTPTNPGGPAKKKARRREILRLLENSSQQGTSSSDIAAKMPLASERTIRHDLKILEQKGFLAREGETHHSVYRLKTEK